MAKKDDTKKSHDEYGTAAKDLLQRLSHQYDADTVDHERKMADTLTSVPATGDDADDSRFFTEEFERIIDKISSEKQKSAASSKKTKTMEIPKTDEPAPEKAQLDPVMDDSKDRAPVQLRIYDTAADDATTARTVDQTTESDMTPQVVEQPETDADSEQDYRVDTDAYADRIVSENTIASFAPTHDPVKSFDGTSDKEVSEPVQDVLQETNDADQGDIMENENSDITGDVLEKNPSDTVMMKAFGLDPRSDVEKVDAKKIFGDNAFESTDEMDALDAMSSTEMEAVFSRSKTAEDKDGAADDLNLSYDEYTDNAQKQDVLKSYRYKYSTQKIKMIVAGIFAIALFVIEALPRLISGMDLFNGNVLALSLVDSCIMICCGAIAYEALANSIMLLFKGKFNADTVTLCAFFVALVFSVLSIFAAVFGSSLPLYNFVFAVCVLFSLIFEFYSIRADIYAFKIASSAGPKSVIAKMTRTERYPEEEVFSDHLGDYSDIYKVDDTEFVSDFFKKKSEPSSSTKCLLILLPMAILAAVIATVISVVFVKNDLYTGLSDGYMAFAFCAPITALISFIYPMYLSAVRAYSNSSAIIGDSTPENNEKIAAIAFSDTDAFPPERIKIKSVKVFENYHIENVIYFASSVFAKTGGPLATVFKQATLDSLNSEDVDIKEVTDTGIDAFVDGRHIVIGQPSYMESQCFEMIYEPGDEEYEGQTNRRILYLACDEVVVSKFYVQYNVSSDFLYIVRHLCKEGVCVSIRTTDPCIDNDILYKNKIDPSENPVRVIKGCEKAEIKQSVSAKIGSIISTGSRKGLIRTFLLCDKILKVRKANLIVKIAAVIIGMVLTGLAVAAAGPVSSIYPVLYQLIWMFVLFLIAKISI